MSEPGFREIQLNTKQVVFLFIAGVAAAVGIFLLGVTAGRGASADRNQDAAQAADPAADVKATGTLPPATTPKPDELKYHDDLQGKSKPQGAVAPPTPPDVPPETSPKPTPTAVVAAPKTPPPSAKPTPTPAPAKPAPAGSGYYVQVDSFGSRDNASRQLTQLKSLGISAFIFEAPGPGARYKVRVGPFSDLPAAEVMRARLRKEGFKPSVTR